MDMQQMAAQPGQSQEAPETAAEQGGYEIVICVAGDGSLSVGVEGAKAQEPAAAPGAVPGAPPEEEAGYQPAADIKDALTQALAIFKNNGTPPAADEAANQAATAGFQAGYAED